jgi:hypothetical protein
MATSECALTNRKKQRGRDGSRQRSMHQDDLSGRLLAQQAAGGAVRAQSIRGRMELDGLYLPARAPWLSDLKAELLAFPTGKHDDIVDALGLVGQLLDTWAPGRTPIIEAGAFVPPRDYVERYERRDELLSFKVL